MAMADDDEPACVRADLKGIIFFFGFYMRVLPPRFQKFVSTDFSVTKHNVLSQTFPRAIFSYWYFCSFFLDFNFQLKCRLSLLNEKYADTISAGEKCHFTRH